MTPPPDPRRLDDLLVRHWAGDLSAADADELDRRLTADPAAADLFEAHLLTAVAVAEGAVAADPRPDRRRWLKAGGLALGGLAAGGLVAMRLARPAAAAGAVLTRWTGAVWVQPPAGGPAPAATGDAITDGETVRTVGPDASAVLTYPDGASVVLTGDTEARVAGPDGRRLVVERGAVAADLPADPFTIATPEAAAAADPGARLLLSRAAERTEVGVTGGRVRLTGPGLAPLAVGEGEVATVDPGGAARRQPATAPPDAYAWDLARPPPPGWALGRVAAGRAMLPELWDDPHIRRTCWQIRSDSRWARGLFQVHPDTTATVRYRVDRPGVGQLLTVIRPDPALPGVCNVLLAPLEFAPAADGGWRTARLPVADWAVEQKPGRSPPGPLPWTAFLVVFNTYEQDLGLRVAEFSVARGGPP